MKLSHTYALQRVRCVPRAHCCMRCNVMRPGGGGGMFSVVEWRPPSTIRPTAPTAHGRWGRVRRPGACGRISPAGAACGIRQRCRGVGTGPPGLVRDVRAPASSRVPPGSITRPRRTGPHSCTRRANVGWRRCSALLCVLLTHCRPRHQHSHPPLSNIRIVPIFISTAACLFCWGNNLRRRGA